MKIFDTIQVKRPPSSVFDLSRENKLSMNMGELIPIMVEEVLPGDFYKCRTEIMVRLAPMLAPVMHRVNVWTHSFYVPNRLVWDNWHDHITGGDKGDKNPAFPTITVSETTKAQFAKGTLADYLGVPAVEAGTTMTESYAISALPFRAYQLIYNEYYRDQDLINEKEFSKGDGGSDTADQQLLTTMRNRPWEKDYLTSARPSAQKGASASIPLNTNIAYKTIATATATGNPGPMTVIQNDQIAANGVSTGIDNLESVTGEVTISDLRASNKLQEWLELAQRGGSRINEVIRNFFGVTPDDLRLTRPQYLGGSKQPVVMSEVLNTAGDTGTTLQPLGEYGGHGVSVGNQAGFKASFKEHGYVLTLMSVLPVTAYQQSLPRHYLKFDKFQRYWPQFANIGEQEILRSEAYMAWNGTQDNNKSTFGYAPRYAEYKYACSEVHGDFRKESTADNLSYWHMGRYFETAPTLSGAFVDSDPTHRIFAVTDESVDKLYVQIYHNVRARRKMSYHSTPSLV